MREKNNNRNVSPIILKPHDPFVRRKALVLLAAGPSIAAGFFSWVFLENRFYSLALYCVLVTLLDTASHYVLRLKPSAGTDPAELLALEGVTPAQFDAYFDASRWIKCTSLATACIMGGMGFVLLSSYSVEIFCGAYALSTIVGFLWRQFVLKIPTPNFHRGNTNYIPRCGPKTGHISLGQYIAARDAGIPLYGPIDPHA